MNARPPSARKAEGGSGEVWGVGEGAGEEGARKVAATP